MALDFNSFLKGLGVGGNSPVVQPTVQNSQPQQQSALSGFMGGLKKVAFNLMEGFNKQQASIYGDPNGSFSNQLKTSLPGQIATKTVNQIEPFTTPEKQAAYNEKPVNNVFQAAKSYIGNRYIAPVTQLPSNVSKTVEGAKEFVKKPSLESAAKAGTGFLGAVGGVATFVPDPIQDVAMPLYDYYKGVVAAQKKGEGTISSYKTGLKSLIGKEYTGLGDAFGKDETGKNILNLAELPVVILASHKIAGKRAIAEQVKQLEPEILSALRNIKHIKEYPVSSQMDIIGEVTKLADRVIPDIVKTKEMRNLSLRSPSEWMNTVSTFMADRLVSVQKPELNVGLNVRELKKIPDEVIENAKTPAKTIAGPMTGPVSQTELSINQGVSKNIASNGSIALPEKAVATPVNKIIEALSGAKPIRAEQEALYSAERARRISGVVEAGKIPGEAGYFGQLSALKGELPKVNFESIRSKITQPDIDELFNSVEASDLLPLEKVTAKNGLAKLLGAGGGVVPTEGEIKLLDQIFPPEFTKAVLSQRPVMQKLFEGTQSVLNVPRAVMASFDVSAPFRQGIFLVGRPKQWIPAFRDMFKYLTSDKALSQLNSEIKSRPTYNLMRESKLALTDTSAVGLSNREEAFMSNLAERIPIIGKGVKASQRAYTGFLNKLRADVFDDILKQSNLAGVKQTQKLTDDLAKFINSATGRGDLGSLNKHATLLNTVLFSPRLLASRINLLNPVYYAKLDPFVRKEALKSLLSFGTIGLSIVSLAKMAGADVETAPNSADFGKIKVGDTRYDPWGGFQQYIRLAAQLISGKIKSSTTGATMTLGEGYNAMTRKDILERFIETKEAPVATFITGLLRGTDQSGEKFNVGKEVVSRFIPLVFQDLTDLAKDEGLIKAGIKLAPGLFGIGVQNYSSTPVDVVRSYRQVEKEINDLLSQGKTEEAQKMQEKNSETLRIGPQLEPLQSLVTDLNNYKETIQKTAGVSDADKNKAITETDKQIKELESQLDSAYKQLKQKAGPMISP